MADFRWALTRKVVDGETAVKAPIVVTGFQYPDVEKGSLEDTGCVGLRSSDLPLNSSSSPERLDSWSLEACIAFLRADTSAREVYVHAPLAWAPKIQSAYGVCARLLMS